MYFPCVVWYFWRANHGMKQHPLWSKIGNYNYIRFHKTTIVFAPQYLYTVYMEGVVGDVDDSVRIVGSCGASQRVRDQTVHVKGDFSPQWFSLLSWDSSSSNVAMAGSDIVAALATPHLLSMLLVLMLFAWTTRGRQACFSDSLCCSSPTENMTSHQTNSIAVSGH